MICANCGYGFDADGLFRGLCRVAFHEGDPSCRARAEAGWIPWPDEVTP